MNFILKNGMLMINILLKSQLYISSFIKHIPENIADVLIKANAVNGFYSTNIYDIYSVADCIVKADIDEKLKLGSVEAVDAIRYININGKIRNCYSFATKYCSHHNAEDFPIFDSYVEHVLMHLNKIDKFYDKKSLDLHNYGDFKFVLLLFKNFYKLNDYTLKQIDQYLWQLGKEYFPNKY